MQKDPTEPWAVCNPSGFIRAWELRKARVKRMILD